MFRDPPHYLRELRSTSTPKRYLWLACRGTTVKRGERFEQRFHAGVLGSTHWTAKAGVRKDATRFYSSPKILWLDAAEKCVNGKRQVLFAWDLAEQMRLSAMLTHLPAAGWELDKIVLERTAAWCLLRNGKRSLMCCDLKSWTPVTWEKLCRDLDNTVDVDRCAQAGPEFARQVLTYRAAVVRDAVLQITNWIEGENLGAFRPTGSGQSYSAFRRRFIPTRLLVHDDEQRLGAERVAMHTGRSEAWRHGTLAAGPYVEYDIHAAYATIGRDCLVPAVARGAYDNVTPARLSRLIDRYAVLADITVDTDVECLPYQINGRTIWPAGTFRTTLWDPELQLALDYANKITVHRAWTYTRQPALQPFCSWVLTLMDGQTQVYGPVPQRVLKHWSRCLVGRLGLRYRMWHRFGPQDPPDVRLVTFLDIEDGIRTDMLLAGSQRLLLGDMVEAPESLPQIPGWVMSECRRRLWLQMVAAGSELVYVDTDSIILQAAGRQAGLSDRFADPDGTVWVRKGDYSRLTIHGPRNIEVGGERRISGLPLAARQTAPLEYTGEIMRSVKRSMRNGELDLVVSVPREFRIQPQDLRRGHNPDGSTYPYRLEQHDDQ